MSKTQKSEMLINGRKPLLLDDRSPFIVVEAYKALRTNIIFSLPGVTSRCIAITSAGRSEGKTTNSINLAVSFGQLGKKVLLIDADMRLPRISSTLEIKGHPGLSDVLVEEVLIQDVIFSDKSRNIDVLPAGTIPPDPTKLLESDKMQRMLAELRTQYDYILVDLPPVNTVTDALILSSLVDGYILLVKHNATKHTEIARMTDQIRRVGGKALGFLYVDADVEGGKYYKKYGYEQQK